MEEKAKVIQIGEARKLEIATADSRLAKRWKNDKLAYADFIKRLQVPTKTQETVAEYKRMGQRERGEIKDVGGFVGGYLSGGARKSESVRSRSLITLDMDHIFEPVDSLWDTISAIFDAEMLVYSTHSHTPDRPRLRMILPLKESVSREEYEPIARYIASEIGINLFDDSTFQASRLMYWPSCPRDGEYVFLRQEGLWIDGKAILKKYTDWKDSTSWPVSDRQDTRVHHLMKKQEDPLSKDGLIGAFCRTYTIEEAMQTFIPDVYAPTRDANRYTYVKGSTYGGLVIYEDKWAYSHHGTDPTSGELCNAWDLVRVHLFHEADDDAPVDSAPSKLPSFQRMEKLVLADDKVKETLMRGRISADEDFSTEDGEASEEDLAWTKKLTFSKQGKLEQTIDNVLTILENDTRVKGKLVYNEFSNRALIRGAVPWNLENLECDWSDADDSGIRHFLENSYELYHIQKIEDAKNLIFNTNTFHPVRDYLNGLRWDGVPRLETALIDYLGAEDTSYTRAVTDLHFRAAVARVLYPGVKYDTMVSLIGPQGCGKTTFIQYIGKVEWFTNLDTVKGKEAAELIQGFWQIEMGELNATKRADSEAVKSFLSKTHDSYRVAYAKNASRFPRQCVFWGTTNDIQFLRDPTGDRRTLPVQCMIDRPCKSVFKDLKGEVDEIWAEAVTRWRENKRLIMPDELQKEVVRQQELRKEISPLRGMILEYLDMDYPANWEELDLAERRSYIRGDRDFLTLSDEMVQKDKTCVLEIWCELLEKRPGDLKPINSREINDILRGLPGWEQKAGLRFGKLYGRQRGYTRKLSTD